MDKPSDKFAALRSLPSGLARRVAEDAPKPKPDPKIVASLKQAVAAVVNVKASEAVKRSRAKKPDEYREKHKAYMRAYRKRKREERK